MAVLIFGVNIGLSSNKPLRDRGHILGGGMMEYREFLESRMHVSGGDGVPMKFAPYMLFPFQKSLVEWALKKERSAIFADCGLGKTAMQLTWAKNISIHTGKPVLVLTPLAVSEQTKEEGDKFGIDVCRSSDGIFSGDVVVTNYEKLHMFNFSDFGGVVCDESSILKNFDGKRKTDITQFMRKVQYRLLTTATAAPNDYIELGTSSEALGHMGYIDMLNKFFKNDLNNSGTKRMYGEAPKWRFKGHAEIPFWRWVSYWAKACRYPSDIGFSDEGYNLPKLTENYHIIDNHEPAEGFLFHLPAVSLDEQRAEKKRTVSERCQKVADLVNNTGEPAIVWCHMNDEAAMLKKLITGSVEISGTDKDDKKEQAFSDFRHGKIRVLITKPKIGAMGLNFQHCNHVVYFPSHSYEQYYQAVRRCWRFGQKREVRVDIVLTEGERRIMDNLARKNEQAKKMFDHLVREMNNSENVRNIKKFDVKMEAPEWM
jgi:superfamily II DNA or RNA helicase